MNDIGFAIRQLRKHLLTNTVIVVTVALLPTGVSVMFTSIQAQKARMVPFAEPDRLVKMW